MDSISKHRKYRSFDEYNTTISPPPLPFASARCIKKKEGYIYPSVENPSAYYNISYYYSPAGIICSSRSVNFF